MMATISGLGLVSSVGHDVVTACASIRAGLSRAGPVGAPMMGADGPEPTYRVGHPIVGITDGYCFLGRWMRMAGLCLADLASHADLPAAADDRSGAYWGRTALFIAIPDAQDRVYTETTLDDRLLRARFVAPLLKMVDWPLPLASVFLVRAGHAGALVGIHEALGLLRFRTHDRAIVLGVDSWVETSSVAWLSARRRLKCDDTPCGLLPGEASGAFLVEPASRTPSGNGPTVSVAGIRVREDPEFDLELGRSHGRAWSGTVREAIMAAGLCGCGTFEGDVVSDLNGENCRAYEYGSARTLLTDVLSDHCKLVLPAVAIGDTGAASGAVGVCVAARSLVRGYATTDATLVTSRSDDGWVGSIVLRSFSDFGRDSHVQ